MIAFNSDFFFFKTDWVGDDDTDDTDDNDDRSDDSLI